MPLVVPGVMTSGAGAKGNNQTAANEEWMNKLLGKKLTEGPADETTFSKKDLPKEHRIVEHEQLVTTDHVSNRLNIHLGPDGTVVKTEFD